MVCGPGDTEIMSRIWDALRKVEQLRGVDEAAAVALPDHIRLTKKQSLAIRALLRTSTLEEAASAAEVTEVTLRRWLGRPAFVAEYYRAGRGEIEESMRRLDAATESAVAVLEKAREVMGAVGARVERLRSGDNGSQASEPCEAGSRIAADLGEDASGDESSPGATIMRV